MAVVGLLALKVVLSVRLAGRISLNASGKRIFESRNCSVLARLHADAGTVAVLMIWMHEKRQRWREPISWYSWSIAPLRVVSRYS